MHQSPFRDGATIKAELSDCRHAGGDHVVERLGYACGTPDRAFYISGSDSAGCCIRVGCTASCAWRSNGIDGAETGRSDITALIIRILRKSP